MGIKGIYGEIGPGERIALAKLAVEHYEVTGKPLRVAIDISIWQFQIQAGQGGSNPTIRTLYYRLLKLLGLQIQPLFIFDGPHKPPFKRGKKTGPGCAMVPNLLTKQLLKLFGFAFYMAPGEAEAECALLQREGVVDAVLSEDVDTLMFGCGITLRNWSSENVRGNKSPTHISVYDAVKTKSGKSGLDREGMILVALMSGGDYIQEGIPGCGPKVACEAARAGFGKSLCRLSRSDAAGLEAWRENLAHEIQTNESKFFRTKHKSLKIPEDFPNREVLSYYTHPVVSSAAKLQERKFGIEWDQEVDVQGLRLFVAEAFMWTNKIGAIKFVRGLAPVMLVQKLRLRGARRASGYGDVILTAMNEMELVRAICGKRTHISSDGIPELRIVYHPLDIVGLDLDAELDDGVMDSSEYGRDGLAPIGEDDQIEAYQSDAPEDGASVANPTKRAASQYDPTQPDKLWVPETMAKIGVPLKVEDWEESQRNPSKFLKQKAAAKRASQPAAKRKATAQKGLMDAFVKVTKRVEMASKPSDSRNVRDDIRETEPPPSFLAPSLYDDIPNSKPTSTRSTTRATRTTKVSSTGNTATNSKTGSKPRKNTIRENPPLNTNPWTLAQALASPQITNTESLTSPPTNTTPKPRSPPPPPLRHQSISIDLTTSSPLPSPPNLTPPTPAGRKHSHSPAFSDNDPDVLPPSSPVSKIPNTTSSTNPSSPKLSPRKKVSPSLNYGTTALPSPTLPSLARKLDFGLADVHNSPNVNTRARGRIRGRVVQSTATRRRDAIDFTPHAEDEEITSKTPEKKNQIIDLSSSPLISPDDPSITSTTTTTNSSSAPPTSKSPSQSSTQRTTPKNKKIKKFITLRDSLPGGWKEVGEEEAVGAEFAGKRKDGRERKVWRVSEVEVLDLVDD